MCERDKRREVGRYNNNIYWRGASAVCVGWGGGGVLFKHAHILLTIETDQVG